MLDINAGYWQLKEVGMEHGALKDLFGRTLFLRKYALS